MHVVPTPSKGGRSLQYLTTELTRFVMWTGHQAVCFRCDNEPSCHSLLDATRKALKGLGVHTTLELVVPGDKQANGAAEVTVQVIRNQANLLIQQVEQSCGADDQVLFGATHPLYSWALVHASWQHNRFSVSQGETPYERCTGKVYSGKLCMFGETVMGYLKPSAKGLPSGHRGVWLGKTFLNDAHVVSCRAGIFVTKSVRRIPSPWVLDELKGVEITPWDCSFATLGAKLFVPKRVLPPPVLPAVALPPAEVVPASALSSPFVGDEEAQLVEQYALNNPGTPEVEHTVNPSLGLGTGLSTPIESLSSPVTANDQSLTATSPLNHPEMHQTVSSPRRSVDVSSHVRESQDDEPPTKQARIACVIAGKDYEHEDERTLVSLMDHEVDALEAYEYEIADVVRDEDEGRDSTEQVDVDALLQQLMFPHTDDKEPELDERLLADLDEIAKQVEIARLKALGVLLPPEHVGSVNPKHLSTRFVITWRDKVINGRHVWLRRARYVAREYAWLSPERQDLFSPASSSITSRLLPAIFLHWRRQHRDQTFVMSAIDITDAFLTVDQREPTLVSCGEVVFSLGKVLPGQRDGSQAWYESMTGFMKDNLQMESCVAYPSLLKAPHSACVMLLHVDDMQVVSTLKFFREELVPALLSRYKASVHEMIEVGDSIDFLKRRHVLVDNDTIHIQQHSRHFDKLFEVVGVSADSKPKKTPCHELINEEDPTPELDSKQASRFRSAIGILMYLASDLVECAYAIRGLAQQMSKPTQRSWMMLKHLALYLLGARSYALQLRIAPEGLWHSPANEDGLVLELFWDSDWASHKRTRRSVSAGMIFFQSCLLSATSRSQRVVALSSAEAELHAAVSATCDGILLRLCLVFCLNQCG